jgi:hypothetical protein
MMDEQRRVQASKPKNERLFIGGEIEIHYLSDAGFTIYTLHQFDDYDRDETAIYDRFRETEK